MTMGKGSGDMDKRIHKPYSRRLLALALVIALCFTAMTGPVCAADDPDRGALCGKTAHSHTAGECYTERMELVCALEENEEHSHSDECYASVTEFFCDEQEHVHSSFCYARTMGVVPARTENGAQEAPETPAPEETAEPEETAAPAATAAPEETEAPAATEAPEATLSLFEQLLASQTLRELHDLLMADPNAVYALTDEELTAVKTRAEELYASLAEPTQDDEDYYALIADMLLHLAQECETAEPVMQLDGDNDNIIYFDLYLGDVTVNANGYTGKVYVYDGTNYTVTEVSGSHSDSNRYYVFQSNPDKGIYGYVTEGGQVDLPNYPEMEGWGSYISQYHAVNDVVNAWEEQATDRASTGYKIHFSGAKNYKLTIDDIWSHYTDTAATNYRYSSSITFVTAPNGTMDLTFVGHNRIEGLHYSVNVRDQDSAGTGNRMNLHGAADSDTLTAIHSKSGSQYYATIGGAHTFCAKPLEISGGILYAGAQSNSNATAIGGGANGDAVITISGGTVTAVTNSNGTAIGGGFGGSNGGADALVTINGGTVNAYNDGTGVAIGGGTATGSTTGGIAVVSITGGTVTASTNGTGPAIGGGNHTSGTGGKGTVEITGGTVKAQTKGTVAVGGGTGKKTNGETIVDIAPEAVITKLDNSGVKKVAYFNSEGKLLYTFYRSGTVTPGFEPEPEEKFAGLTFLSWNTQLDGTGAPWSETLSASADYYPMWGKRLSSTDTVYFDLALDNVIIDGNIYKGKVYDQVSQQVVQLYGRHTEGQKYYVYQSTESNRSQTGIKEDGTIALPEYSSVSGWASYITNNQSVSNVVSEWETRAKAAGRTATNNRIHVTGSAAYDLKIDNIWSDYVEVNTSRTTGGVAYNPSGGGSMQLTFIGDNRVENVGYRSQNRTKLTITGETAADTLTAAATKPGNSYWNSAIGSDNGHKRVYGLTIAGGTIFAGTHRADNCTALGGGGNAVGEVFITGGTVTAVASTSGAAIGGGIGFHGVGGDAYVTIRGNDTKVYAYNHGIILQDTNASGKYYGQKFAVPAVAIGGGSSVESSGNAETVVNIEGGTVVAQSVYGAAIGGGGSSTQHGGKATINISGGTVIARSIGGTVWGIVDEVGNDNSNVSMNVSPGVSIGGGTGARSGGNATLNITGGTVLTGSIGGGLATEEGAPLGYAKVTVAGGNIQGQVIMQETGVAGEFCSFTMSGGTLDNQKHKSDTDGEFSDGTYTYYFIEEDGGAVCMKDSQGETVISGEAVIRNCRGINGGAVYMTGGSFTMTGGTIQNCAADVSGGAVYLGGGKVTISGGSIEKNTAEQSGGAVYVRGGSVAVSGGSIRNNEAAVSGGGIAVADGRIVMSGGSVSQNTARNGHGGGMFVSSSGGTDPVAVMVYSGTVSGNTAPAGSGGAVAVSGGSAGEILVQIGVNENHYADGELDLPFDHTEDNVTYTHASCPVITENSSYINGGAFYITGGSQTQLNMYCLEESGNITELDKDINNKALSNFLQVQGGAVIISTAEEIYVDVNPEEPGTFGHAVLHGSVHVTAGTLDLYGTMENPAFKEYLTIDLTSEADHFIDHRYSEQYIKLIYHENFYIDGAIDAALTAMDIPQGTTYTILGSMYGHPGYEMIGWNTDKDANAATKDGWYRPTEQYLFVIDEEDKKEYTLEENVQYQVGSALTLYAIWEPNAYFVTYDANTNGEKYSGSMPEQTFSYDKDEQLEINKFVWPGHSFLGWRYTKDDGTEFDLLGDGATVRNLTAVKGATVTLRAQWEPCNHPEEKVTYSVEGVSEKEQILKKTCTCGYEASVTLKAEDAVYDGKEHKYHIVYSDEAWTPAVSVTAVRIKPANAGDDYVSVEVPEEKRFTDAGVYTVSVTGGEGDKSATAKVEYTIAKAEQPAPTEVPQYVEPAENSNVLTIMPIGVSTSPATEVTKAEYAVKYYEADGKEQILGWSKPAEGNRTIAVALPQNLKNYYVYVRYEENDNYLPSDAVMADAYFHYGNVTIVVKDAEGITLQLEGGDKGLRLSAKLQETYYLVDNKFVVTSDDTGNILEIKEVDGETAAGIGVFDITCKTQPTAKVTITLTVGTARKTPVPLCRVGPGQIFGTVSGTEAVISRDSAYTVYFELKNYDEEYYQSPVLSFGSKLPAGTTIILQNKTDGSYWSRTLTTAADEVTLINFIRMGTENEYFPAPKSGDLRLQFVVDFSRCSPDYMIGDKLTTTLEVAKKEAGIPEGIPDLAETLSAEVSLFNTAHSLTADNRTGSARTLTCGFTEGVSASRWDDRDLALVLTPTSGSTLPPDAVLRASVGNTYVDCRPTTDGKFIVPVGEPGAVTLELRSAMFPSGTSSYAFDVVLYSAFSIAERAPMNGTIEGELSSLTFSVTEAAVSLKVTGTDDKRVFDPGETISVTVATGELPTGYKVVVQLHQKDADGTYINRGQSPTIGADGTYSFSLTDFAPGSYCVMAMVQRDTGLTVAEAPYYFIVQ